MLYVFLVDTGTMIQLDMGLALETVGHLKTVLARACSIPPEKQVLLISGGESLDPSDERRRVCDYSTGTDTNPIFLFSTTWIENSPVVVDPAGDSADGSDSSSDLNLKTEASLALKDNTQSTVAVRAALAQEYVRASAEQTRRCEEVIHEQRLQHQGWLAVVANLEDSATALNKRAVRTEADFSEYLENREKFRSTVEAFDDRDLPLLSGIPVFPAITRLDPRGSGLGSGDTSTTSTTATVVSLRDWIESRGGDGLSLEHLAGSCHRSLQQLDRELAGELSAKAAGAVESSRNAQMKEIRGFGERLSGLEQLLGEAKRLVQEQADLAAAFLQNQNLNLNQQRKGASSTSSGLMMRDLLPDLCASHRQQLVVMRQNHQRVVCVRARCARAKEELSANLHQRMKWVVFVQNQVAEVGHLLFLHGEELRRLRRKLEVVDQLRRAPSVYLATVVEIVRRRAFSGRFSAEAGGLAERFSRLHHEESRIRSNFQEKLRRHFLAKMFPGMEDLPPAFATEKPPVFDDRLPDLSTADVDELRRQLPQDLAESIIVPRLRHMMEPLQALGGTPSPALANILLGDRSIMLDNNIQALLGQEVVGNGGKNQQDGPAGDHAGLNGGLPVRHLSKKSSTSSSGNVVRKANNNGPSDSDSDADDDVGGAAGAGGDAAVFRRQVQGRRYFRRESKTNNNKLLTRSFPMDSSVLATLPAAVPVPASRYHNNLEDDKRQEAASINCSGAGDGGAVGFLTRDHDHTASSSSADPTSSSSGATTTNNSSVAPSSTSTDSSLTTTTNKHLNPTSCSVISDTVAAAANHQQLQQQQQRPQQHPDESAGTQEIFGKTLLLPAKDTLASLKQELVDLKASVLADQEALLQLGHTLYSRLAVAKDAVARCQADAVSKAEQVARAEAGSDVAKLRAELELESSKLDDCSREVEQYRQQLECCNAQADKAREEFDEDMEKLRTELGRAAEAELVDRQRAHLEAMAGLRAELEAEADKAAADFEETVRDLRGAVAQLEGDAEGLRERARTLEASHEEAMQAEKDKIVQILEAAFVQRERLAVRNCEDSLTSKHLEETERLRREAEERRERDVAAARAVASEELSAALSEQKRKHERKFEELRNRQQEVSNAAVEMERNLFLREKELALQQQAKQLRLKHKCELDALRARFKIMSCSGALDRSPSTSESELTVGETRKDRQMSSFAGHDGLANQAKSSGSKSPKNEAASSSVENLRASLVQELENTISTEKAKWERQLAQLKVDHERAVDNLREELSRAKSEKEGLETELGEKQAEFEKLRGERAEETEARALLEQRLAKLEEQADQQMSSRVQQGSDPEDRPMVASTVGAVAAPTASGRGPVRACIGGIDRGETVVVLWDMDHQHYLIFNDGPVLHFLHSDSVEALGLDPMLTSTEQQEAEENGGGDQRIRTKRPCFASAVVVEKQYCQAKKAQNRFRVPEGTKFFRVKCRPANDMSAAAATTALAQNNGSSASSSTSSST